MGNWLRRTYGAHPAHLITLLGCFALAGYVLERVSAYPSLLRMAVWFVGAAVAHDLLAFPVYALADRVAGRPRPALHNYIRIPAAASALLLLVYLPGIIRQGGRTYHAATGQTQQPFLARWLALTALFAVVSAVVYAIRALRRPR